MPRQGDPDTDQFSITLPLDAIEMIENGLIHYGLYGKKRATVTASLILDVLKTSDVRDHIREGREKAARLGIEPKSIESLATGRSPKGRTSRTDRHGST
jgi:hypothetical protein